MDILDIAAPGIYLGWGPFVVQLGNLIVIAAWSCCSCSHWCCHSRRRGAADDHDEGPFRVAPHRSNRMTRSTRGPAGRASGC